jgi:hypothetical protein
MPHFIVRMMTIWNAVSLLLVIAMTITAAARIKSLPATVPAKFDVDGTPGSWSGRKVIWFYPIFALVLLASLAGTGNRREDPINLFVTGILFYTMLRIVAIARKPVKEQSLQPWFMPASIVGLIALILIIYL